MKRLCLLAALSLAACGEAAAVGKLADVSIIDRNTGSVLPLYQHRGEYWVAGMPGHRYSIQINSRQHGRLLAVTSVDGLNVLTGDAAGFNQRGYVYQPWQGYEITGWRKSSAEVAAFTFTSLGDSYAARTGRPANVGVIGIAVFRERPQPVLYDVGDAAVALEQPWPRSEAPAALASSATAERAANGASGKADSRDSAALPRSLPLGTGHGARESSWVQQVDFERESPRPNEVIRIRYDSYANLVAMGVIRRPSSSYGHPQAFPGEGLVGYVPDP